MSEFSRAYAREIEVQADDIEVPEWIEQDIEWTQVAAIAKCGCASGAYMPAVTYWQANETMAKHGDDVLTYIQDHYGELPAPSNDESWSGMAVHYLSVAVESWAWSVLSELEEMPDDDDMIRGALANTDADAWPSDEEGIDRWREAAAAAGDRATVNALDVLTYANILAIIEEERDNA